MGKQGAIRENERLKEAFILIMFTIYQLGASISFVMYDWSEWIPYVMLATIGINWLVFVTKKVDLKGREAVCVCCPDRSMYCCLRLLDRRNGSVDRYYNCYGGYHRFAG